MNFLLDTCVLSEYTKKKPSEKVLQWLDSIDEEKMFISVLTIGELKRGIERMPESARKTQLLLWLNDRLVLRFDQRLVTLDTETMLVWGSLVARFENEGKPMALVDSLIAASALRHNLVIVTRNQSDFFACGLQLLNPWN